MASQFREFDRSRLRLKPLTERVHDLSVESWLRIGEIPIPYPHQSLPVLVDCVRSARAQGAAVILMIGAHVLRAGVSRHIIDLIQRGFVTHVAMNGAGPIHEYELSRIGCTTESVARYSASGEFGLWLETGELNDVINRGAEAKLGLGESVGKFVAESDYPYKDLSVLAAAYRHHIPVTVHVGIGYDITHEHPNCNGAALGETSYRDFLIYANTIENLEGGVLLCFGSAVMGPEIYLKALTMARNVAHQSGKTIKHFTTAVFDLIRIEGNWNQVPEKSTAQYYYRPWKTILARTVADGGQSFYFCGEHRATVPALHRLLVTGN